MSNNTDTYWSVKDTSGVHRSLHTFAHSIATLGGDANGVRALRGSNLVIPHAFGERRLPKVPDAYTLTLGMWVIGANPDGTIPTSPISKFWENWRALQGLLWRSNQEFELQKRFRDNSGVIRSPIAMAEYFGGMEPTMNGQARASFAVDLRLADPFFYEAQQSKVLAAGHQTVSNSGTAPTRNVVIRAVGSRGAFTVYNHTTQMGVSYNDAIGAGQTVNLDVRAFTAKRQDDLSMISSVTHTGGAIWMEMAPGDNDIELIATGGGTGAVTFLHQNAWL